MSDKLLNFMYVAFLYLQSIEPSTRTFIILSQWDRNTNTYDSCTYVIQHQAVIMLVPPLASCMIIDYVSKMEPGYHHIYIYISKLWAKRMPIKRIVVLLKLSESVQCIVELCAEHFIWNISTFTSFVKLGPKKFWLNSQWLMYFISTQLRA